VWRLLVLVVVFSLSFFSSSVLHESDNTSLPSSSPPSCRSRDLFRPHPLTRVRVVIPQTTAPLQPPSPYPLPLQTQNPESGTKQTGDLRQTHPLLRNAYHRPIRTRRHPPSRRQHHLPSPPGHRPCSPDWAASQERGTLVEPQPHPRKALRQTSRQASPTTPIRQQQGGQTTHVPALGKNGTNRQNSVPHLTAPVHPNRNRLENPSPPQHPPPTHPTTQRTKRLSGEMQRTPKCTVPRSKQHEDLENKGLQLGKNRTSSGVLKCGVSGRREGTHSTTNRSH